MKVEAIPFLWRPYLRGRCFDFALALHQILPGSDLVAFGNPRFPDHVAVRYGPHLIDIRGPQSIERMLDGMCGAQDAILRGPIEVSVEDVALHCGAICAGGVSVPVDARKIARQRLNEFAHQLGLDDRGDAPVLRPRSRQS